MFSFHSRYIVRPYYVQIAKLTAHVRFLPAPFSDGDLMIPHWVCAPPLHFWSVSDFPREY